MITGVSPRVKTEHTDTTGAEAGTQARCTCCGDNLRRMEMSVPNVRLGWPGAINVRAGIKPEGREHERII